jgi:orotate phosphoribosyltransferase
MMLQAVARPRPQKNFAREKQRLLEIIRQKSLLKGHFKLASGAISSYYLDMKPTTFDPEGAALVAEIAFHLLAEDGVECIGGIEMGAVPIVAAVCARSWPEHPITGFIVRKEKKGHGTDKKIDGNFTEGTNVVLFDDVTTKGGSVLQAVEAVRERGGKVAKVITVVDRLEGATENLHRQGIELVSIFTKTDLMGPDA